MSMQTISIGDGQRARQHPLEKSWQKQLELIASACRAGHVPCSPCCSSCSVQTRSAATAATDGPHLLVDVQCIRQWAARTCRVCPWSSPWMKCNGPFANGFRDPNVSLFLLILSLLFCRFYLKSGTARRKCGRRFECWLTSAASQRNFYSDFLWFAPNFF